MDHVLETGFNFHAHKIDPWARTDFLYDKPKVVAIDYDQTISDNEGLWLQVMRMLERAGYHVVVCTWRSPTNYPEDLQWLVDKGYKVYYTSGQAKDKYVKSQGVDVAIWIDDFPYSINNDLQ